jgi:hypothetical protein
MATGDPRRSAAAETFTTQSQERPMAELEIPNFPMLLMEPLLSVPEGSRVGFISQLERTAAQRYREWADEDPSLRDWLVQCADREDEIADRAAKLIPIESGDEQIVADALAKASALYASAFEGHSLRDRITLQAHAERQGSMAWIGFSGQTEDEAVKAEFMVLAGLEVASADQIDGELNVKTSETA